MLNINVYHEKKIMPIISLYFGNKPCALSLVIRVNFIQILYFRVLLPVDKMFDVSH